MDGRERIGRDTLDGRARVRRGRKGVVLPLLLILLAIGTSVYAIVFDRTRVSDADRAMRAQAVFPSFRMDEVMRVELSSDRERFVLARPPGEGSVWTLTRGSGDGQTLAHGPTGGATEALGAPTGAVTEPADAAAVDVLLHQFESAQRIRDLPNGAPAGPDVSPGTWRVRGRLVVGHIEYTFVLGSDAMRPTGAAAFRLDGEGACIIDRALRDVLLQPSDAYRPHSLVPYGASEIARIEAHSDGTSWALERSGTTFRLGSARGLRADRKAVERVLGALADLRADAFLDESRENAEPHANAGIDAPRGKADLPRDAGVGEPREECAMLAGLTVRITPLQTGQTPVDVILATRPGCSGQPQDVVAIRTQPDRTCACVPKSPLESLIPSDAMAADTHVFFAHADEIEEIRLERVPEGDRVELVRRGGGWRERAPQERDLEPDENESADVLAAALASAQASDVQPQLDDAGSHGPATVRLRATLVRTEVEAREEVDVGSEDATGRVQARRSEDGALLVLPREVARRLEPHTIALRSRSLWRTPLDQAQIGTIDTTCGVAATQLNRRGGAWVVRKPAGGHVDSAAGDAFAEAIGHAQTAYWAAEADDGTFGVGKAGSCTVALTLLGSGNEAPRTVTATFGAEMGGTVYGRTSDGPGVFAASAELVDLIRRPLLARSRRPAP